MTKKPLRWSSNKLSALLPYEDRCACKERLSYNGELSVLLFDLDKAMLLKEEYIAHYISEEPVNRIFLI